MNAVFFMAALMLLVTGCGSTTVSQPRSLVTGNPNGVCLIFCRSAVELIDAEGNVGSQTGGAQDVSGSENLNLPKETP